MQQSVINIENRVDETLFRQLISTSHIPLIGSALGSILVTIALATTSTNSLLFYWLELVYITIAIRTWLTFRAKQKLKTIGYEPKSAIQYSLTSALSGIAWGAASLLMIDAPHTTVIIVTTSSLAMVMGGILTLGSFIPAFFAFAIPAIIPMIVVFILSGGTVNMILGVYSAIFFGLMISIALQFNKSLRKSSRTTFEKEDLIHSLSEANARISTQNMELNHAAYHEPLTGLPNRMLLAHRMQQAIAMNQQNQKEVAVLYIDLNGFKPINDKLGHDAGDAALREVSKRLSKAIRTSDTLARVGGDEFVILISEVSEHIKEAVELVAQKCLAAFEQPFLINQHACQLGASIGLAVGRQGLAADQLIAAADLAMYKAKMTGVGGFSWADSSSIL